MQRFLLRFFVLLIGISSFQISARAEWGYGYGVGNGYGGWGYSPYYGGGYGATVQGSILTGMGYYLNGLGEYNLYTAQAESINAQTWITLNEYIYQSQQNMNRQYWARVKAKATKRQALRQKRCLQLRDQPTASDIKSGDALNLKARLLTSPGYAQVVYETVKIPVSPEIVSAIPFAMPSQGIAQTISLFSAELQWPASLSGEDLAPEREAVQASVKANALQAKAGEVNPQSVSELKSSLKALRAAVKEKGKALSVADKSFLTGLDRSVNVLSSKAFVGAMKEIQGTPDLTVGKLLQLMNDNSLSFSTSTTSEQTALYGRLFNTLATAPMVLDPETQKLLVNATVAHCE